MIFAPYKLSTFKNHAKQLKRIAKNFGVRLSTMESLNLVARSFNAKSWNHLFLEHDTLSKCLYEKPNHPISNANIHFIEDLNFNKKDDVFTASLNYLEGTGLDASLVGELPSDIASL